MDIRVIRATRLIRCHRASRVISVTKLNSVMPAGNGFKFGIHLNVHTVFIES
jgi:hypothetical protein